MRLSEVEQALGPALAVAVVTEIVRALTAHGAETGPSAARTVRSACDALAELTARRGSLSGAAVAAGAVAALCSAMEVHAGSPDVAGAACAALHNVRRRADAATVAMAVEHGVVERVLEAIDTHSDFRGDAIHRNGEGVLKHLGMNIVNGQPLLNGDRSVSYVDGGKFASLPCWCGDC